MFFVKKRTKYYWWLFLNNKFYFLIWDYDFITVKVDELRKYEGRHVHDRAWGHLIQDPYMLAFPVDPGQSLSQCFWVENVKSTAKKYSSYEFCHIDNLGVSLCRLDRWTVSHLLRFKLACKSSHSWGHADTRYSAIPDP